MNPNFYILTLNICGIKNIEKTIQLDFYKKTINKDFNPEKYKIKAIYGENGSGKTAIITSVNLMKNILINKNYLSDNETQNYLVQIVNKKTKKGFIECEIYVDIDDDKVILRYFVSFEVKEDGRFYISKEKIGLKNGNYSKNNYVTVFETENGSLIKFGNKQIYEFYKEKTQNLLDKQSLLSCVMGINDIPDGFQKNNEMLIIFLLMTFAFSLNICIDEADVHTNYRLYQKMQNIDENNMDIMTIETFKQIKSELIQINHGDMVIPKVFFDIYEEKISRLRLFIQIFKPDLLDIEIEKKDYDRFFKCTLKMVYEDYTLDQEFESRGIKKMMDLFYYLDAASAGMIVFIDELDSNINDVYLDKIIEFFMYYGKGQLCFTSHNLSPMEVLKTNKNAISFISGINTVHTWTKCGNLSPENAYKNGFIQDSPFNVDASDFLGILGGADE